MTVAETDGRVARRVRNREAVVQAALDLVAEGRVETSLEDLTTLSGVSPRSVFRYFETLDDLRREVIRTSLDDLADLMQPPGPAGAALDERVDRFVAGRLDLYRRLTGPTHLARSRAATVPAIREELDRFRTILAEQTRAQFRPELGGRGVHKEEALGLVEAVASFDSYELLADHRRWPARKIARAWTAGLGAILVPLAAGRP